MSGTDPWRDAGSEHADSDRHPGTGPLRPGGDNGWAPASSSQGTTGWPPQSVSTPHGQAPTGGWPITGAAGRPTDQPPADDEPGPLHSPLDPATGGIARPRYVPRPTSQGPVSFDPVKQTFADPFGYGGGEENADDEIDLDDDEDLDDDGDGDEDDDEDDDENGDYGDDGDYAQDGDEFGGPDGEFGGELEAAAGARRGRRFGGAGRLGAVRRRPRDEVGPRAGRPAGRHGPRILMIVVAVAAVVGVTYWTMTSGSRSSNTSASLAPLPTVAPVPSDFLDSAYSDGDPVTQNEFFRQASVVAGTHTYTRIARKLDQGCPDLTGVTATALAGQAPPPTAAPAPAAGSNAPTGAPGGATPAGSAPPAPTAQVTPGPLCRQLVRALYLGEPDKAGRRLLAGINVVVVDSATTAKNAVQAFSAGSGGVNPLPLPANALPGAKISSPNSDNDWRTSFSDGHYAVLVQLAYSDGTKGKATDAVLVDAATDLKAIATAPLDDRRVLGRGFRG